MWRVSKLDLNGAWQARNDEGNLKFEVSETDSHVFRVDERWTSKRTMFKCAPDF